MRIETQTRKPRVIYIAGPFRARKNPGSQWEQYENILRAEWFALAVWKLGHVAICPHLNTLHFQGELPDRTWLDGDLVILERCDGILMVPGWSESTGAKVEHDLAKELNLDVFYTVDELRDQYGATPGS